jgi:hypothetical protein
MAIGLPAFVAEIVKTPETTVYHDEEMELFSGNAA